MRRLGKKVTGRELDDMIAEIDLDGNGVIDFSEFQAMLAKKKDANSEDVSWPSLD